MGDSAFSAGGGTNSVVTVTSNYTALGYEKLIKVDTTSNNVTVTVLGANVTGKDVTVKKISTDSNKLTITAAAGQIDGKSSITTTSTQKPSYTLTPDGSNYNVSLGYNEGAAALETNTLVTAPRLRVSRSATLALNTSYQRLDFSGTSSFNINTFPTGPDGSNSYVYWDSANKLFKFQADTDRNYDISLYLNVAANTLIGTLNLTMATIKIRLVVPSPTPIYFPFPDDSDPHVDINTVNSVSPRYIQYNTPIYANASIRQYGLGVELSLSNVVLGTVNVASANLVMYGK